MSFLVDHELETWIGHGGIIGGDPRINPVSVDLTLGHGLKFCNVNPYEIVESHPETASAGMFDAGSHYWGHSAGQAKREDLETGEKTTAWFILQPGQFALGTTAETVDFTRIEPVTRSFHPWADAMRHTYGGQVHGKSTLGRNGLMVHVTAGLIDPGFRGQVTLELFNVSPNPLVLKAGQPICQLQVYRCTTPHKMYDGHYQDQTGTTVPWTK